MRLEGWKNQFKGLPEYPTIAGERVFETIFEAGADAMLEGLSKLPCDAIVTEKGIIFSDHKKYRIVFIPEEE